MGILSNNPFVGLGTKGTGYQINQSLRFDGSAYLNRTPASAGNRKTWTWSGWVKRSKLGVGTTLFSAYDGSSTRRAHFYFNTSDQFVMQQGGGGTSAIGNTTAVFRDVSAWYHFVFYADYANTTFKLYVNNAEQTISYSDSVINADGQINATVAHTVGSRDDASIYFDGYLAEVNFIDGTALTPSSFGETDTITGAWIPKKYSGSYGTNGFYLKFQSSGIGTDSSGNGNNWTATGFVTSGTGTDVMSDTPTTNWCTLNPLTTGSYITLSNGNLDALGNTNANNGNTRSTFVVTGGKFYFEMTLTANNVTTYPSIGIMREVDGNRPNNGYPIAGYSQNMIYGSQSIVYQADGTTYSNSVSSSYGSSFTNGDVIGVAYDGDNGAIYFSKNGTWQNSGDPTSGASKTGAALTWTDNRDYVFSSAQYNGTASSFNFGQRGAFAYTPPTGFKALNTANLPEPTIKKGGAHFNTVLYTGDSAASHAITGVGFQPDFLWIKRRNGAQDHQAFDAVRGADKSLQQNATNAESDNDTQSSFDADGFTLTGAGVATNSSGGTFVAWNWKANGAGSSNTAGTITSTVSANASAGFSIATYTGTGSNASFGHGLGVVPSMCIIKQRNTAQSWWVWHQALGNNVGANNTMLELNGTAGTYAADDVFRGFTSSVVNIGTDSGSNTNGGTYVAYCFSEVAGYSKFGSYTGNGSSDGPFVFCGFRPAWILTKRTDASASWTIEDAARIGHNPNNYDLYPDTNDAEGDNDRFDILSNGFKARATYTSSNASGGTYIFAAFSETAFKFANAR